MSAVESTIVLLARPTTFVGAATWCTMPLDVSGFGSIQFQLWRGPIRGTGTFKVYFEESLDALAWALGPATPVGYDPADSSTGGDPTFDNPQLFAYAFRLRWFRLRVVTTGSAPIVTCFAEGLLRDGGGGGAWAGAPMSSAPGASVAQRVVTPPLPSLGRTVSYPAAPGGDGRDAGGGTWGPDEQNPFANIRSAR